MEGLIKDPRQAAALSEWIRRRQTDAEQKKQLIDQPIGSSKLLQKMAQESGQMPEDIAMDMATSMSPMGAAGTLKGIPKTGNILKDAGDMIGRIKAGAIEDPKDFNSVMKMFKDLVKEGGQKARSASSRLEDAVYRESWRTANPENKLKAREVADLAPGYWHFEPGYNADIVPLETKNSSGLKNEPADILDFEKSLQSQRAQRVLKNMRPRTGDPMYRREVEDYLSAKSPELYKDEDLAHSVAQKFADKKNLEKAKSGEFLSGVNKYAIGKDAARAAINVRNKATNQIKKNMQELEALGRKIEADGPNASVDDINFYDEMRKQLSEQMRELRFSPRNSKWFPEGQRLRGGDIIEEARDLFAFTRPKFKGEGRTKVIPFKKKGED